MLALALALALQQDAGAEVETWRGERFGAATDAVLKLRVPGGTLEVPLSAVMEVRFCRVRADEAERRARRLAELAATLPDGGEETLAAILELGPAVNDALARLIATAAPDAADLLRRVKDRLDRIPFGTSRDLVIGPGFRLSGWIEGPDPLRLDTRYGSLAVPVGDIARIVLAKPPAEEPGGAFLVEAFGSRFRADLSAPVRAGDADVAAADVTAIEPGRVTTGKGVRSGAIGPVVVSTRFGSVTIPASELVGAMSERWTPAASEALTNLGCVRRWLVAGSWRTPEDNGLTVNFLDVDEEVAAPKDGEREGDRAWKAVATGNGDIDLGRVTGTRDPTNGATDHYYAAVYVAAPEAWTGTLGVNSDDGVRVWVNGRLVVDHHEHRGREGPGADQNAAEIALRPGLNRVLVKIDNGGGPTGFSLRFVGKDGKPAALKTTVEPPPVR